jgi:hypothetical protein
MTGLSSIVVEDNYGQLVRAYLCDDNHRMWTNTVGGKPELGIHDHKYNIKIQRIQGEIINHTYDSVIQGDPHYQYDFTSIMNGGSEKIKPRSSKSMLMWLKSELLMDYGIEIPYAELHTVEVREGKRAAWLVTEGGRVKDNTKLFSREAELDLSGKYDEFKTADEVRQFVWNFFQKPEWTK